MAKEIKNKQTDIEKFAAQWIAEHDECQEVYDQLTAAIRERSNLMAQRHNYLAFADALLNDTDKDGNHYAIESIKTNADYTSAAAEVRFNSEDVHIDSKYIYDGIVDMIYKQIAPKIEKMEALIDCLMKKSLERKEK